MIDVNELTRSLVHTGFLSDLVYHAVEQAVQARASLPERPPSRDEIALRFMSSLLIGGDPESMGWKECARAAYEGADALIAQRDGKSVPA